MAERSPATTCGGAVVHIVDDEAQVRCSLAMLLRSAGVAVETHASALAFLDALPRIAPGIGCVVTDLVMPGLDGLGLIGRLRERALLPPVIVMSAHGEVATAVQAMKLGAMDFIEKPFDDAQLLEAIRSAMAGADARAPHGAAAGGDGESAAGHPASRIRALSPREREVLDLLMAGKPTKVVAHDLGLSPRTVEVHRARMMARLGVQTLAQAVRLAVEAEIAGLVPGAGSARAN